MPRASSPLAAPAPWAAKATAAKTESPSAPAETPQPARSAVRASPEPHTVTPSPAKADNGSVASGSFGALGAEAGSSRYDEDEDEQTVIAGVGALAGAFSQAVKAPDSSTLITTPSDEWYVGINGVPVGPIRLSELRSKAASGAISQESLVWREGFEQWQALGTFPELIAIVEEGLSSARASLTPLSPPASHVPQTAAFAPTPAVPVGVLSDPFALPAEPPPPSVERAPFPELAVVPPRRSTGAAAWIAVVVALLFGLTIGFVLFSRDKAEPVVKIVEVPAKTEDPKGDEPTKPASTETETVEVGANPKIARGGGPLPKSGQTDKQPEKTGGLSGLKGLSAGTDGPSAGSGGGNELAGGPTNQLDSGQVQKVVSRYTSSVKRSCWQPALDTRIQDAPTSARVSVTITVGPSGSVSNVTTSGDPKGYRGLASCIASRVRGWQFPASSGTTTVNVPFFFAAQ